MQNVRFRAAELFASGKIYLKGRANVGPRRIVDNIKISPYKMAKQLRDKTQSLPGNIIDLIPQDSICSSALVQAADLLAPAIFNHSLRVYLLARWLAEKEKSEWAQKENLPLLFVSCICHDFGTCEQYNGTQRFEVEGADAAENHLLGHGYNKTDSHKAWIAIALHTSAGIAERIDPLTRLVRLGVKMDFSPAVRESSGASGISAQLEEDLPRLDIEKVLADAVVKQAVKIPGKLDRLHWPDSEKHPKASWPGILLRAHLLNPEHEGVNPAF